MIIGQLISLAKVGFALAGMVRAARTMEDDKGRQGGFETGKATTTSF